MVNFESDTHPLSEYCNPLVNSPAQIVEINCAAAQQHAITIVTLTDREPVAAGLNDAFSPELRNL